MKPHKKWDCPCTDCQKWYRDEVKRLKALLRRANKWIAEEPQSLEDGAEVDAILVEIEEALK